MSPGNPIGAGDIDGNHGEIVSVTHNATTIEVVTRPLQWACHNVSCECEFRQEITLEGTPSGTGVRVTARLTNHRTDVFTPKLTGQELPAVYSNGPYVSPTHPLILLL
jgi:hypothetical protein